MASFINPARWQRGGSGTGLLPIRNYFFTSKHLAKFITLPDSKVFPGVGIGDICIELLQFNKTIESPLSGIIENEEIVYKEYIQHELIDIVLDKEEESIVLKVIESKVGENFERELWVGGQEQLTKRKSSHSNYGRMEDFAIMVPRLHRDTDYFILENERKPQTEYVKVYYTPKPAQFSARFIERSELQDTLKNNERLSKWKALIPKTNAHFIYRNLGPIAEPGSLSTNTWLCRSFDSEIEVVNFQSYIKTYFYRFLISIRGVSHNALANVHRFVPDLINVTNPRTGLVGYNSDWTNEDLKKLFKDVLTDDDWAYIEKTAIESDPVGAKK
jgi:hypothetical protein